MSVVVVVVVGTKIARSRVLDICIRARVSTHVVHCKGSMRQLLYKRMEINRELCLSAHGHLPRTLRYIHNFL